VEELALVGDKGEPTGARRQEDPGAVLADRDLAVLPVPGSGRPGGDDVAVAVSGSAGRTCQVAVQHGELDDRVEHRKRLVVGDVLLRLVGH